MAKLEEGRWYRYPGEGVAVVLKITSMSAMVRIYSGEEVEENFDTAAGEHVSFRRVRSRKTHISALASLEPASDDEVKRFQKKARPGQGRVI